MISIKEAEEIHSTEEDKYSFVNNITFGKTKVEEIIVWLTKRVK